MNGVGISDVPLVIPALLFFFYFQVYQACVTEKNEVLGSIEALM